MSELIIIQRHPNAKNLYICSGKPDTKEDVQHYYFACRRCGGELKLQPQFWKNVSDGIDIMCWTCAGKEGFDTVHHYNMSISIKSDSKRPIIPLDELTKICGFFSTDSNVNNYYNCKHPKCRDGDDDEETGKWVGACTSFNGPLANDYESEGYKNVDGDHRMVIHDPETISKLSNKLRKDEK